MTKRERIKQLERQVAELTKRVEAADAARVAPTPYPVVTTPPFEPCVPGTPHFAPTFYTPWTGDSPDIRLWTSIGPQGPFSLS